MKSLLVLLPVIMLSGCVLDTERTTTSTEIENMHKNIQFLGGTEVVLSGFIQFGFDGWHTVCVISDDKTGEKITSVSWLEDNGCYEAAQRKDFRTGKAKVTGIVVDLKGEVFRAGSFFKSQIEVVSIEWN